MSVSTILLSDKDDILKERILLHSFDRFVKDGFYRVSMDEISSELGISKKTLYRHVESKEDLLRQVMHQLMSRLALQVNQALSGDEPFVERLHALLRVLAGGMRMISKPLLIDIQRYTPEIWASIQEFRRNKVLHHFSTLIEDGKRSGHVRPDVNTRIFLLAFLASVEHVVTPDVLANESFSAEEAIDSILRIYFQGTLTPGAVSELEQLLHS